MCGTDVGAALSSHTKLKTNANTKKTEYVGQAAGTIQAADASAKATPAAATPARAAAVRRCEALRSRGGRCIPYVLSRRFSPSARRFAYSPSRVRPRLRAASV